jgi:hypothetical protein
MKTIVTLVGSLALCFSVTLADDTKARAIMEKVYARNDGQSLEQDIRMTLIKQNETNTTQEIKSYRKNHGTDRYTALFFTSPSHVQNAGFLVHDYGNTHKQDEQWLYLPASKSVESISGVNLSKQWMQSDFSYFDFLRRDITAYDFTMLRENHKSHGYDTWLIEAIPRNQDLVNQSGYPRTLYIIRKDNHMILRALNFKKDGKRKCIDILKTHQVGEVWVVDEVTITTKIEKDPIHKTILTFSNIKLNQALDNTLFTTKRLKEGL